MDRVRAWHSARLCSWRTVRRGVVGVARHGGACLQGRCLVTLDEPLCGVVGCLAWMYHDGRLRIAFAMTKNEIRDCKRLATALMSTSVNGSLASLAKTKEGSRHEGSTKEEACRTTPSASSR